MDLFLFWRVWRGGRIARHVLLLSGGIGVVLGLVSLIAEMTTGGVGGPGLPSVLLIAASTACLLHPEVKGIEDGSARNRKSLIAALLLIIAGAATSAVIGSISHDQEDDVLAAGATRQVDPGPSPTGPLSEEQEAVAPWAAAPIIDPHGSVQPIIDGGDAIARTIRLGSVTEPGEARAKLMTWADYKTSVTARTSPGLQAADETVIWVAAVAGTFRPPSVTGVTFPWGLAVLDSATGTVLTLHAEPSAWPTWFDRLPDARASS